MNEKAPNEPKLGVEGPGGRGTDANRPNVGVMRIDAKCVITHSSAGRVLESAIGNRGRVDSICSRLSGAQLGQERSVVFREEHL